MNQYDIGKFISELRRAQGLTQEQLAEKMGVTNKSISRWETGQTLPDISLLIQLSEILNITLPELLKGSKLSKEELSKQKELIEDILKYDNDRKYEHNRKSMNRLLMGLFIMTIAMCNNVFHFFELVFTPNVTEFVQGSLYGIGIAFELISVYNLTHKTSIQEKKQKFLKRKDT